MPSSQSTYGNTHIVNVPQKYTDAPGTTGYGDHETLIMRIAGLALWFDASDLSTSGALQAQGRKVRQHVFEAVGSALARDAAGIDSKPTISFDGTNDNVLQLSAYNHTTGDYTLIAVAKNDDADVAGAIIGDGDDSSGARLNLTFQTGGRVRFDHGASEFIQTDTGTILDGQAYLIVATYNATTGAAKIFLDDSASPAASGTLSVTHKGSSGLALGAMGLNTIATELTGDIAEVLAIDADYGADSRAADRHLVMNSLKAKFSI